jgi:hypothetical protein
LNKFAIFIFAFSRSNSSGFTQSIISTVTISREGRRRERYIGRERDRERERARGKYRVQAHSGNKSYL